MFDYSKVDYKTARIKVEIGCNTCGTLFFQVPDSHSKGRGCPECARLKLVRDRSHTKEFFIQEALKVTESKYNYDLVEYKNARTKVKVKCNDCGEVFTKTPDQILHGFGCRCHAIPCGYKPHLEGTLYVLNCEDITKIGITNEPTEKRIYSISKSFGKEFSIINEYKMDGQVCTDLETVLLRILRKQYKNPPIKFDGYTECFLHLNREFLFSLIEAEKEKLINDS